MRFAALPLSLSLSLGVNLSVTVCLCLTVFVCFVFLCQLSDTQLSSSRNFSFAFSFLSFLFFFFKPFGLARPTPCRYVSSYIHYLAVRITSTAPSFVQILSPHLFCFLFSLERAKITIYTFDVLHHHNLDINS